MILEEYNEELHIKNEKDISFEDGIKQGVIQGEDIIITVFSRLKSGESKEALLQEGYNLSTINKAEKMLEM